ncbi:MAG: gliding motility-associated ABC transporter permease subunit GldF [Bacteroidia bacterium]|nr:gliding motility-associated ABC transporter permease subunit GldF [Bacteroidia bacterium]
MYALFTKEIKGFLNSLIGYVVMIVFLVILSLFMWVFPGENNLLDAGYANMDTLFAMAPWVFMFLIPAITMRAFADEKKLGTLELLVTKPLSELKIVMAKFWAGVVLVIIALLPTLVYYYSVHHLGFPQGNLDAGATWGSYIGLVLLSVGFVAIGIFASAITDNQIISFLVALLLCFIIYIGLDYVAELMVNIHLDGLFYALSINQHYLSLSRGVIDTRDVIYFVSLAAVFILLARLTLEGRKWY